MLKACHPKKAREFLMTRSRAPPKTHPSAKITAWPVAKSLAPQRVRMKITKVTRAAESISKATDPVVAVKTWTN
jgi:hypothetical protein